MMRQVTLIRIAAVPLTMQWDRQFIWEVAIRYVSRLRLSIGLRLKWSKVPYELTWSCYEGGDKPCGVCGTCRDRAEAFRANGVLDPALH